MGTHLQKEDCLIQIRDKLRRDGVKLWLPPYVNSSNNSSKDDIQHLAEDYSSTLKIPLDLCLETLLDLQRNALENLKQKNRFQESGLATIKIKILLPDSPPKIITKELLLSMQTSDLKSIINQEVNFCADRLKLISSGKVLNDAVSLGSQGVKNGQQILAIAISETPTQVLETENQIKELENIKTDSRLLALDNEFMQLEDQFGNPIKIPPNEKKALIVAMTLHEKGKSALKRLDYSRALVFFLEADEEFRHCNSQLLNTVDNYALLNLDIAWCYLCLESFAHLPEAYERLKKCEEKFHSTYGPNLERLIAVKGTPGYSPAEATLGLRATKGDVNYAANYINETKEKRAERRKKAKAEEILKKERKKLGKCADGEQYVDPNFVKILVNMGFNKEAARIALQKTNNIISDSIQYIQENPLPGPSGTKSKELLSLIEDLIPELESAGFDARMAKLALEKHSGDIMQAAEELLANNGIVSGDLSHLITSESIENIKKKKLELDEKNEAFKRLAEDISIVDDDYLDIDLVQEEIFLKQYLSLLEKDNV
ncbi:NEDD8 ultimate buster 1 isoform X2 [Anoplophora glabripennis]|uniref:NEDD8 ultimate buster 1 isoform X2 n=1 Tax=Anoplophora glabripennis TaxID=217634 RepID=UPI0008747E34|nr:NEDD8 ultimate buster 1 isoform X2 [Anoplophora glabripennis]